jgi:hypothetical protein
MVCLRNISVDTLHKGETKDNNNKNNKVLFINVESGQPNNNNNNNNNNSKNKLHQLIFVQLFRKFHHFKGREGSLLLSQEPAIGPLPEPDESSPYPPTLFFDMPFNTITFTPGLLLWLSFLHKLSQHNKTVRRCHRRTTRSAHFVLFDLIRPVIFFCGGEKT